MLGSPSFLEHGKLHQAGETFSNLRIPKVVDRLVIDVSSSLTTLQLATHFHYQVFDPVVDF